MSISNAKIIKAKTYYQKAIQAAQYSNHSVAEQNFAKVLEIIPHHHESLNNLALSLLLQQKQAEKAERLLKKCIQLAPKFTDAYVNLLQLYLNAKMLPEAARIFEKLKKNSELSLSQYKSYILVLQQLGQFWKVKELLTELLHREDLGAFENELVFHYANNSLRLGEYQQAILYFNQLLNKEYNVVVQNNLAMCYLSIRQNDKAEKLLRDSIKVKPDYTEAYRNLSMIKKIKSLDDNDLKLFQQTLAQNEARLSTDQKSHLYFAIAKAYDDLKEYQDAIEAYKIGNRFKREGYDFDIHSEVEKFNAMKKVFKHIDYSFDENTESQSDQGCIPIFIVGMPRSGTSLLEQIFSSVDNIAALGELTFIENLMTTRNIQAPFLYPEEISKVKDNEWQEYKETFLNQSLAIMDKSFDKQILKYLIDKQPFNFWHIGIIFKMFPHAKIIHSTRNAKDTCLSNFFQYFHGNLSYSDNLIEVGQYYKVQEAMMNFWKEKFANKIYTIDYESLVADPQKNLVPLFDYLNLQWDEKYLEFYLSNRPVRTMSVEQVRSPIYKGSVERWRNYEPWIEDLFEGLNFKL